MKTNIAIKPTRRVMTMKKNWPKMSDAMMPKRMNIPGTSMAKLYAPSGVMLRCAVSMAS